MNITSYTEKGCSRTHHFRVESSAAVLAAFAEGPRGIETAPPAAPAEAAVPPRTGGIKEPRTPRLDIPKVFPGGRGAAEVLGPF